YHVSGGTVAPTSAALQADGQSGKLILATPLTKTFTIRISDVTDLVPNTMPLPITLNGTVRGLITTDVGSVGLSGWQLTCDNEIIEIAGSGSDVWNDGDQFHFVYGATQGDFDAHVRVTSLRGWNPQIKAVLIARESTNAGSRELH